jgi:hypothetical protein
MPGSFPDPIAAVVSVFRNNLSYQSDDSTPITETFANNGLDVEPFPFGKRKQFIVPLVEVGPIQHTRVTPQNVGNSPNSRWLYVHYIECHVYTQTFSSPNISGYDAMVRLCESIRQVIVQNQASVDGSGNWLLLALSNGPYAGAGTTVTPDRYDTVFLLELWRSQVN